MERHGLTPPLAMVREIQRAVSPPLRVMVREPATFSATGQGNWSGCATARASWRHSESMASSRDSRLGRHGLTPTPGNLEVTESDVHTAAARASPARTHTAGWSSLAPHQFPRRQLPPPSQWHGESKSSFVRPALRVPSGLSRARPAPRVVRATMPRSGPP